VTPESRRTLEIGFPGQVADRMGVESSIGPSYCLKDGPRVESVRGAMARRGTLA